MKKTTTMRKPLTEATLQKFATQMALGLSLTIATIAFLALADLCLTHTGWFAPILIIAAFMLIRMAEQAARSWLKKIILRFIYQNI